MFPPIATLLEDLATGRTSSAALTGDALAAIEDREGEGGHAFTVIYRDAALAAARAADALRAAGVAPLPLGGLPVSIKDLFDVAGETTLAGSRSRAGAAAASADATVVARLRAAGAVIIGKTQMVEFAFSGLGLNPYRGTPRCVWDRGHDEGRGRAPGGSSSGAGISVADGMAVAAIGTDTGGSVRIPAAFNGLTGFKPTARRVPSQGCFPLSSTLDSIGPLARTVACCARLDAVLSGRVFEPLATREVAGLRLGLVTNVALDELDAEVATTFERAVASLSAAGAQVARRSFDPLNSLVARKKSTGGIAAAEAWHLHRAALERDASSYDPRVAARIRRGAEISAADYLDLIDTRKAMVVAFDAAFVGFDAWIMPTVARIPPPLAALEDDDAVYAEVNVAVLRNPSIVNFLDGCALTLPIHRQGEAPVGLTLFAPALCDEDLLSIGAAIEARLARS